MGDQDFNFNPPPPRREANKAFEPPPWEKEQFEELARRKEAERTAASAVVESSAEPPPVASRQADEERNVSDATTATPEPTPEPRPVASGSGGDEDDPRIAAMLIGLKSEEPSIGEDIWKVSIAAGSIVAVIGALFVVWGFAAMAATKGAGATGSLGGGILIALGLLFVGGGMWMVFRTLRQRGVL